MTEPTQLHALADGELDSREAQALREVLKVDPKAATEVDAVLNLKEFLTTNSPRHTDEEAWRSCVRRLDAIDRSRRAEGFVGRYAWAICGVMFLFILSGRVAMRSTRGDSTSSVEVARVFGPPAHVTERNRMDSRLYEAILGQAGRNLDPKEIEVGMPRRGAVDGFPAQRFPMRDGEGDLILTSVGGFLEIDGTQPLPSNPDINFGIVDATNGLVWHRSGQTWVLSGARSVDSLEEVATRLGAR